MTPKELKFLNRFNYVLSVIHLVQAVVVYFLSSPDKGKFPLTVNFLKYDAIAGKLFPVTEELFTINLAWLVIAFFLICSFAHLIIATIYRNRYESDLAKGINKARWFEYSLSASVMMLAIGLLSGIYDFSSLIMIFVLDALMNMFGLVMELVNSDKAKVSWLTFILGCIAGVTPWIVFLIYVLSANKFGGGNIPDFVYWIYVSIFLFFNSFAVNMFLQYKKIGPWKDYLFGEKVYMVLSLVAKSLLAWQVFAGTLRP